jgi:hypothetical protein
VEWLGPESPGAARDGSSPAASDDLPHLPNPLQHEPPNGDT